MLNPWLTGFADQLALLSNLPPAYIGLAAIVPLLIALMSRDLLATLWTALFAFGAISLCATQEINWTALATFEVAAGFLLAFATIIRRLRGRALRTKLQAVRDELSRLEERLNVLEEYERRRIMGSLRAAPVRNLDMTEPFLAEVAPNSEGNLSIVPK